MLYAALSSLFLLGYFSIVFERFLRINKAATALLMGIGCWAIYFFASGRGTLLSWTAFEEHVAAVAQIVFFLIAAMAIVELIDSHHGFKGITDLLRTSSKKKLLWLLIVISFFLSSVLDNLTSMIVMISLIRKLTEEVKERWLYGSIVVIAVNAGGAWTPIGDITTTMLWIGGQLSTLYMMKVLFLPSAACIAVSGLCASFFLKGKLPKPPQSKQPMAPGARRVLCFGIGSLIMIPVWKILLGLPPFMGALLGLGILWLVTDLMHHRHGDKRSHLRLPHILARIDTSGVLFFLGILFAVNALTMAGIFGDIAKHMERLFPSQNIVAVLIGLVSSIVDNVPLVAATMGMYDKATYPIDSPLWQLIAYAAGTGGSILIIGSAAGVAFMGIEKVDFLWYLKRISWIALIGYFAGIALFFLFL